MPKETWGSLGKPGEVWDTWDGSLAGPEEACGGCIILRRFETPAEASRCLGRCGDALGGAFGLRVLKGTGEALINLGNLRVTGEA